MASHLPMHTSEHDGRLTILNKRYLMVLLWIVSLLFITRLVTLHHNSGANDHGEFALDHMEEKILAHGQDNNAWEGDMLNEDESTQQNEASDPTDDEETEGTDNEGDPKVPVVQLTGHVSDTSRHSHHYRYLILITSPASMASRRAIIREHYFSMRQNLQPCMTLDSNVYYRFVMNGKLPEHDTPSLRSFEAERMEWNDIVEIHRDGSALDQAAVFDWVERVFKKEQGLTFDYLVLQDIHTFVQYPHLINTIDRTNALNIPKDDPTHFVWGPLDNLDALPQLLVVGNDALTAGLKAYQSTGSNASGKGKYHGNVIAALREDEKRKGETTIHWEEEKVLEESTGRIVRWSNRISAIQPKNNLAIVQVFQDAEWIDLIHHTRLLAISLCKARTSPTQLSKDAGRPASFVVVTSSYIYDKCMEPSARRAADNKRDYALRHGYSFVARSAEFAQQAIRRARKTVWGKIDVVEKVLPYYDWLFWLDMDAVILDKNRRLEDLLDELRQTYPKGVEAFDQNVDLVIARPSRDRMINAGVFLIRNTPESARLLRKLQHMESWYNRSPSFEQGALWDLIREPEHASRVLLLDLDDHTFNTLPSRYQSGDFVVHFAPDKCPNKATIQGLDAADRVEAGEVVASIPNTK